MKNYQDLNDYELVYLISENNEEASDILIKKYYKLILKIACKYYRSTKKFGTQLDDLIQEGYIGLLYAMKTFTEEKKCLFYTYLLFILECKMKSFIKRNCSFGHMALNESISLNQIISSDSDAELIDTVEDSKEILPDLELDKRILFDELNNLLLSIPFRYSIILELKINGFKNADISKLLDISMGDVNKSMFFIRKKINSLKNEF